MGNAAGRTGQISQSASVTRPEPSPWQGRDTGIAPLQPAPFGHACRLQWLQRLGPGECRWFRGKTPPALTSPSEKLVCMSLTLGSLNSVSIAQRE